MAFLDIVKNQRKQGTGILGSLSAGARQSSLERMDPRNRLFKSGTLLNALFPNVKGYKAGDKSSDNVKSSSTTLSSVNNVSELSVRLDVIGKNTLVLPSMARDMYLVKQNIVKLVKLQGGTPQTKSGDWFSRQQARENAYEARYNKTKTSPSKVEKKDEKSGGGFLGGVLIVIGGVASAFGGFLTTLGVAGTLLFSFGGVIARILGWLVRGPLGVLLGLSAFMGVKSLMSDSKGTGTGGGSSIMNSVIKSDTTKTVVDTAAGIGGTMAAAGAVSGASKVVGAAKATGTAILDARTTPSNISFKDVPQKTYWGKFLSFLEKKLGPRIFAKIGARLAAAGALAAIPVFGWVNALIQLGFSVVMAWEIFSLWREFNNMREEAENTSPQPVPTPETYRNNGGFKLDNGDTADYYGNAGMKPPTSPSKSNGFNATGAEMALPKGKSISAKSAVDYLVSKGLSPAQAAGVVGNLIKESTLDSGAQNKAEGAYGLAQWRGSRLQDLAQFASSRGKEISDVNTQLDFIMHEMNNKESRAGAMLRASNTAEEAAFNFGKYYERPKTVEQSRMAYANSALKEYGTGGGNTSKVATNPASDINSFRAELQSSVNTKGFNLNSFSSELSNAQRKSGQSAPVNIDASTKTTQAGGGNQISLPASGVIDNELAKLLVERAIG